MLRIDAWRIVAVMRDPQSLDDVLPLQFDSVSDDLLNIRANSVDCRIQ